MVVWLSKLSMVIEKKIVKVEKYNFVTTHIGRRTFATAL